MIQETFWEQDLTTPWQCLQEPNSTRISVGICTVGVGMESMTIMHCLWLVFIPRVMHLWVKPDKILSYIIIPVDKTTSIVVE